MPTDRALPAPWLRCRPDLFEALRRDGMGSMAGLSSRELGISVTDHRSSWVRRIENDAGIFYVKTYDYPRVADQLRGALRTTWMAPSRARREADALGWLQDQGFPGPAAAALLEERRFGVLHRAVLVTEAFPGHPLDTLLPSLADGERDELLRALETFVGRLHAAGFRDRNLDLRNLLAHREDDDWQLCKIDSPRHRIVRAGTGADRAAIADWQRLARSLESVLGRPGRRDR